MLENKKLLVAGGDLRSVSLSKLLAARNTVYTIGLENAKDTGGEALTVKELQQLDEPLDYIVLPIQATDENGNITAPFSTQELPAAVIFSLAEGKTHILGGKLTEMVRKKLDNLRITYTDYLLREELAIKNAVPTAEGAIEIAMRELPVTIWGIKALVIGYGRIGKVLSAGLKALGARVTVSARRFSDLAWIGVNGFHSLHTFEIGEYLHDFHLVFNTVPSMVLTEELLKELPRNCLVIDLASKPGGVDFEAAERLGVKTVWALSLPGKVAPKTAGEIIFDTIQNIDSERRYSFE